MWWHSVIDFMVACALIVGLAMFIGLMIYAIIMVFRLEKLEREARENERNEN